MNNKPKSFDYSTFCALGIANDSRGGDSCGVFIDGQYKYGYKADDKYFQNYFLDSEFLKNIKISTVAFGHCRKASIGAINESTAQPVIITNNNKVEFVVMHNGTIHNYEDLAKKYIPDIDIKNMTDSQVMTHIFYHKGYDVLSEYTGGAVFAIADYRGKTPKILLFKGASKKDNYAKKVSDERPLYFCIDPETEELVFSSISSYLIALRPNVTTWIAEANTLLEFNGKDMILVKEVYRDEMVQQKYVCKPHYSTYFDLYDEDDVLYDDFITCDHVLNLYTSKGKKLHGRVFLTNYGLISDNFIKGSTFNEVYFWNGIALKNSLCFQFLNVLKKESKLDITNFTKKFQNVIRFLSIDGVYFHKGIYVKAISPTEHIPFTGSLSMISSTMLLIYNTGCKLIQQFGNVLNISDAISEQTINFKAIKKECESMMKQ